LSAIYARLRRMPEARQPTDEPAPKDVKVQIRIDAELAAQVGAKARRYGGLSAVIRALLRRWAREDIITPDEVLAEVSRAAQRPARKAQPQRKK
jgi:Arc/MetJ family transcription regulator